MQYQVPQFIEVEDRIIWNFTLKQILYVAGGIGLAFVIWTFLPKFVAIPAGAVILLLSLSLAFYKYNGRPFINTVESALAYIIGTKLYIWRKEEKKASEIQKEIVENPYKKLEMPRLSESKLKDLVWSLDIYEKINTDADNK